MSRDTQAEYQALLRHVTDEQGVTADSPFMHFGCKLMPARGHRAVIIGFAGPKGCGKSTIAEELVVKLKAECINVKRHRFAQAIKDMARVLGLTVAQIDGDEKEIPCALLGGATPRYFMQLLGTQFGRDMISPDLWVNAVMAKVDADPGVIALIDDVRFPNEVAAIRARGGYIIELAREGVAYDSMHASEAGLPRELIDVTIANADTPQVVALASLVFAACRRAEAAKDGAP